MVSMFRRRGQGPWLVEYVDQRGRKRRRSTRTTDKRVAKRIAAKIEAQLALVREGIHSPEAVEALSASYVSLEQHRLAYIEYLELGGRGKLTIRDARNILDTMFKLMGATRLADVNLDRVSRALMVLRDGGAAARTVNAKRQVLVAFARWAWKTNRLPYYPLAHLPKLDQQRERHYVRRALTEKEVGNLFRVADAAGRGLFYRLALFAGLRRSEIGKLTWADVDLDAGTIKVREGKARREDVLPVHPELRASLLAEKRRNPLPAARVVRPVPRNPTRRADYKAAGIAPKDGAGEVADLHSLRVTLATRLARQGVPPQVAQRLLRHSTMDMTLRYYTRLGLADDRQHLDAMPGISAGVSDGVSKRGGAERGKKAPKGTAKRQA